MSIRITTRRRTARSLHPLALLGVLASTSAFAAEPLTDEQLDAITAGADDSVLEEIVVHASRMTASGTAITADGTVGLRRPADDALGAADLLLRDSAQSDLQALINVNAVQSLVNVLVNLNINIDSHVGEVRQLNLSNGSP
jgi:hypothetical protein